ncbi:M20 family metallopeptidase [Paenibacillus ihuae]|uniref:M20 family metallopeptidase n=1 Tax=Paenibacillus ihuae TaxID=1232431 RepID=UPI000A8C2812|nr:M20 family metallopeptidase [Paenibacillus ihuae]
MQRAEGECTATGGWSYVQGIAGGVNFGPAMPGIPPPIHGPDEYAAIEDLLTAAKIYTKVIIELCEVKNTKIIGDESKLN